MSRGQKYRLPAPSPRRHLWWQVLATLGFGATVTITAVAIGWFL